MNRSQPIRFATLRFAALTFATVTFAAILFVGGRSGWAQDDRLPPNPSQETIKSVDAKPQGGPDLTLPALASQPVIVTVSEDGTLRVRESPKNPPNVVTQFQLAQMVPTHHQFVLETNGKVAYAKVAEVLTILQRADKGNVHIDIREVVGDAPVVVSSDAVTQSATVKRRYLNANDETRVLSRDLQTRSTEVALSDTDRQALKDSVRRTFDARQELLRQEIAEFRNRLDRLTRTLEERDREKEKIIERRIDELVNPNLRWDATAESNGRPNSASGASTSGRANSPNVKLTPTESGSNNARLPSASVGIMSDRTGRLAPAPAERDTVVDVEVVRVEEQLPVRVYRLKHARADRLSQAIEQLASDETFAVRISCDNATNSLVLTASPGDLKTIEGLITLLDRPPTQGNRTTTKSFQRSTIENTSEDIKPLTEDLRGNVLTETVRGKLLTETVRGKPLTDDIRDKPSTRPLPFLDKYPQLQQLSPETTLPEWKLIMEVQKLRYRAQTDEQSGRINYFVPLDDGLQVIVMFDRDGHCRGIQRIRGGDDTTEAPVETEKRTEKVGSGR